MKEALDTLPSLTRDGVVLNLNKRDWKREKPSFKKDILGLKMRKSAKTTSEFSI